MPLQVTPRLSSKPARFPNQIREYRLKLGLSQAGLGKLLGKTRKVILAWERGIHFPAGPVLFNLAKTTLRLPGVHFPVLCTFSQFRCKPCVFRPS